MALNQTLLQLRTSVRKFANVQGTTALLRHPDADVSDYINRALGALHRRLITSLPDQRILSSSTIQIGASDATYSLPSDFDTLISVELYKVTVSSGGPARTQAGPSYWLQAYEMHERAPLADTYTYPTGIPISYRLQGASIIEFLPTPDGDYNSTLWYVPAPTALSGNSDTYDTVNRLDEFVIAYAARPIAIKDKNWDLASQCKALIEELGTEIESLARNRDRNSPPRIVDVYGSDRWGRQRRYTR